jgi:hypothetical protein
MAENSNMISSDAAGAIGAASSASTEANVDAGNIESIAKSAADASSEKPVKTENADIGSDKELEVPSKNDVIGKINDSDNLVTAFESVAAMYCIPSSYIVEDPVTDRIAVTKGHIVIPSNSNAKPSENGKAIIQSIGAVLDYISQRADDKLNQFQADHIRNGINKEKVADAIDSSKGKVVSSTIDANGDPVIVYDTGNATMSNTKEAQDAFDKLESKPAVMGADTPDYSYFSEDEDDITGGTDISGGEAPTEAPSGAEPDVATNDGTTETNVPADIQEAGFFLDAIGKRNNTRHLGYDIMQEQGFNFVKPCDFFVESAAKKKNRQTTAFGIEHMKFDNTKLLKAIKLINEARGEQTGGKGKINLESLINNPKYQEAIDCLNDQFNARLNIRFIKTKDGVNREFTSIYNDIKTHLTISKSKGFQLGGLPIDIFVTNTALDEDAPDDKSLFGQHVISVFCHEIFHNIMAVLKSKESQFTAALVETMTLAKDIPSASNRRKLITNFVNTLDEFGGVKMNVFTKRAMVKHLTYLSTICHDEQAVREYEAAIKNKKVEGIDEQIKRMEKRIRKIKIKTYGPGRYIIPAAWTVATFIGMASAGASFPIFAIWFGISAGTLFGTAIGQAVQIDTIKKIKNGTIKNYEEHWCDMFAACYNLPVTFFMVGKPREGAANNYSVEILKRYDELEREAMQLSMIKYPTISERNQAAVKYAKKTLDSKVKLDPPIKKYLEWIVANYSKTLDMDIDEVYSKGTFDPKTAEDLDKHIEKLIGSANIHVTESDLSWLDDMSDSDYFD